MSTSSSPSRCSSRLRTIPVLLVLTLSTLLPSLGRADVAFTDVALEAGFQDRLGHGRALVADDFNDDGWIDFFVGNPGNSEFPDESLILWSNGPDGNGDVTFSRGQVLLTGRIAFGGTPVDYDGDGDTDLFVGVGGQEGIGWDRLFRNDGGTFVEVSDDAGITGAIAPNGFPIPGATSSGTFADYDNDGDLDLYVSVRLQEQTIALPGDGGFRNSLFRYNGDGTYTDVTLAAGLANVESSMTASWGDYDNDGWMDIFVPHARPVGFELYRNNRNGTFTDVDIPEESVAYGEAAFWASAAADFNQDGLLDVIGWGRKGPAQFDSHALLINQGNWQFVNENQSSGLTVTGVRAPATMGTAIGDYDNNGYPDVYTGDGAPISGERDTLFRNLFDGSELTFEDMSALIDYPALPDPNCFALRNEPALKVEGSYVDSVNMLPGVPGDPNSIPLSYLGGGDDPCLPIYPYRGHGTVFVDYDKDGDLDLAAVKGGTIIIAPNVSSTEPNRLFRNDGGNEKNWLFVDLDGQASNVDGIGARIAVTSSLGGTDQRTIYNEPRAGYNFSAGGPLHEVHFGLGDHDTIERIEVRWPSGVVTELTDLQPNQRLTIEEGILDVNQFDAGAEGWEALTGQWRAERGVYGERGLTAGAVSVNTKFSGSDYSVVARVSTVFGTKAGIAARANADGTDFYAAVLDGNQGQIYKSQAGVLAPLGEAFDIDPLAPRKSFIVRLTVAGSTISMAVNGFVGATVEDSSITSGMPALMTVDTAAYYDNVAIY